MSMTSPFTLTIPVFSALAGVRLLGEPITGRFVVGASLTILGVGVIMLSSYLRAGVPAPSGERSAA